MDRGVTVNAEYSEDYREGAEEVSAARPVALVAGADYGPCLYLGPSGQRCSRRALEGGFCALHERGARRPESSTPTAKRIVAAIGALAALLPWLTDLIRELIRLLR
jgi:hypothetical protein